MLTGLAVSFLACKCSFYRPEHNSSGIPMEMNFKGLEMQKWNKPADRAQRVDDKNEFICLFIMFTCRVMIILISKKYFIFQIFCWWQRNIRQVWAKYLSATKSSY